MLVSRRIFTMSRCVAINRLAWTNGIAKDFAVILWVVEKNAIERTFGA